jgi:hypothetical protein
MAQSAKKGKESGAASRNFYFKKQRLVKGFENPPRSIALKTASGYLLSAA